jgi:hypothetical protein
MFAKMLVAWAAIVVLLTVQAESQYDPLGSYIYTTPADLRKTSSLDESNGKIYVNPYADPLGIDPLMRPLDTEHTWEYLDIVSGKKYFVPYAPAEIDFEGNWRLDLQGGVAAQADLMLLQSQNVVYGRGALSRSGSAFTISASGMTAKDVLYLDLVSLEDLMLYKLTMTVSQNALSGSYEAFDAQGRITSGLAKASRSA